MDISLFDYYLPKELIAQEPIEPRDHSRLLVLKRQNNKIEHRQFFEITDYLSSNDVLVFNDTKVVPSRLWGKKIPSGGKIEILLIRPKDFNIFDFYHWPKEWLIIGKPDLKQGQKIEFSSRLNAEITKIINYERVIKFNLEGKDLKTEIVELGLMPLPPYIEHPPEESFKKYQTIYAKKEGAIAAPTAGFHFTEALLEKIKQLGVEMEFVTLHVGLGTFLPVKEKEIEKHPMHSEYFILTMEVAHRLNQAKIKGKRIIGVGTTVTRVLENCVQKDGILQSKSDWTKLFIYPGYNFKFIDALITNFHLPKSTLLMLVCAFADRPVCAGRDSILKAYQEAIDKKYRFFSFGDAMFII